MKIKLFVIAITIISFFPVVGQKMKYKDLFPILNAKNYAEGGPQLILYLSDPKNLEDPNANLQMGLMLEDRFLKYDVVSDSSKVYASGDSAVTYLKRAISLIDDKELKKNDEFYQSFFRRDLRTGEFGIKVSDVHLDIEKKIEAINTRKANVKSMHQLIGKIGKDHQKAINGYKSLTEKYSGYNQLLLSANDDDQTLLSSIESNGRLANEGAISVKELAQKLGSTKYQDPASLKKVETFGKDGLTNSELKSGTISLWDFENWGRDALSEIRGGVGLFKTMIINYSKEIRDKKSKVKNAQNVEVGFFPKDLAGEFAKYEPGSAIEKLLRTEMHEVKIIKLTDLQINPSLMDSALVGAQLKIYAEAKANVDTMFNLVGSIASSDLDKAKGMYKDYLDSFFQKYGTASKYVEEMKDWSKRNQEWIGKSVDFWNEKNKWGVVAKEGKEERRLPLFVQNTPENNFITLDILNESIPEVVIYGVDMNTNKGYLGSFGEDRYEKWSYEFDLPGNQVSQYVKATVPSAQGSTSFYIYSPSESKDNLSIVSYANGGKLNWATRVTIGKAPVDFKFDDLTQELTILLYPEEKLPLDSNELGYVVIDRTGNAR